MHATAIIVMVTSQIPITNQQCGQKIGMDGMLNPFEFVGLTLCTSMYPINIFYEREIILLVCYN